MREYGLLQAIYMSFYSRKLYRDVASHWGGYAFLYLLLLLALSMVYFTYEIQQVLNHMYVKVTDQFVAQVPVLTIKNGKISTPEKRPYLIKDNDNKTVIAVIDTTGKYKTLKDAKTDLLITEDKIISSPKPHETRIDTLPATVNYVFEPIVVNSYIKGVFSYTWVILYPLLVIAAFFYRVIQALIYAVIGKIFAAILGVKMSYAQTLQIALVAITPVIVWLTIASAFNIIMPNCAVWCFVLAMVYLFYAVFANRQ